APEMPFDANPGASRSVVAEDLLALELNLGAARCTSPRPGLLTGSSIGMSRFAVAEALCDTFAIGFTAIAGEAGEWVFSKFPGLSLGGGPAEELTAGREAGAALELALTGLLAGVEEAAVGSGTSGRASGRRLSA